MKNVRDARISKAREDGITAAGPNVSRSQKDFDLMEVNCMKKIVLIVAHLVPDPEAYKGKSNADIEKEIMEEKPAIPYVEHIEKVTVLDC